MRTLLSGRGWIAGTIAGAVRFGRYSPGPVPASGLAVVPTRRAIAGTLAVLGGVVVLLVARVALSASSAAGGARIVAAATFNGVGYGLLSATVAEKLSQRGGSAVRASGVFDVVKLTLHAVDGRSHVISGDMLSLDARGTYYGVSNPADIGLNDRHWNVLWGPTAVPAHGSVTVKAIFDVPPGVLHTPVWLHIGAFNYAGQARAAILRLPSRTPCCRSAARPEIGPILPSPVLG